MMKTIRNFSFDWRLLTLVAVALLSYKNPNASIHKDYFFRYGYQLFSMENTEMSEIFGRCVTDSENNVRSAQDIRLCWDLVITQQRLDFVLFSIETYYSLDYTELGEQRQKQVGRTLGVLGNVVLL